MKELKEYRDEIFRRSDEKKRQIKKRRRITMGVCIPLCLCCVLMATVPLGGLAKKDFAPSMEAVNGSAVLEDAESTLEPFRFAARVVECGENWVLVEPLEGEAERNSSDRISFSTQNLEDIDVRVGTEVVISYNGQIMETYPAQIIPLEWKLK